MTEETAYEQHEPLNPQLISFKKIETTDIALIHAWRNLPHVKEWCGKHADTSMERMEKKYTERAQRTDPTRCFIVHYENTPVAFIQTYKLADKPDYAQLVGLHGESTAGVDLFIAETAFYGRGFGTSMLKKFVKEVVFANPNTKICLINPEVDNRRAIRSYEKAGFTFYKIVHLPDEPEPEYVMLMRREQATKLL